MQFQKSKEEQTEIMSRLWRRYASGIYRAENVFEFHFNLIMMHKRILFREHILPLVCLPHKMQKFQLNYPLEVNIFIKFFIMLNFWVLEFLLR